MTKLINTFRAIPSPANRVKLQKYLDHHPMQRFSIGLPGASWLSGHSRGFTEGKSISLTRGAYGPIPA